MHELGHCMGMGHTVAASVMTKFQGLPALGHDDQVIVSLLYPNPEQPLEEQTATLSGRRQTLIPEVDPKLLSFYERILVGREGLGMVLIDDTSCLGCHMQLPPQVINEVRLREKMVTCENCSRILYSRGEDP
jgi:hypothetical protein